MKRLLTDKLSETRGLCRRSVSIALISLKQSTTPPPRPKKVANNFDVFQAGFVYTVERSLWIHRRVSPSNAKNPRMIPDTQLCQPCFYFLDSIVTIIFHFWDSIIIVMSFFYGDSTFFKFWDQYTFHSHSFERVYIFIYLRFFSTIEPPTECHLNSLHIRIRWHVSHMPVYIMYVRTSRVTDLYF